MSARILIAANARAGVKPLEARLSAAYFDVLVALSGAETLAICGRGQCDIVLIEPTLPDTDGFSACRRLKSNEATQHVPVVMVTAPINRPISFAASTPALTNSSPSPFPTPRSSHACARSCA